MKIELTKEQYLNLLKLVYLGEWMANAHRTEDRIEKYENSLSQIFSYAKEFGFNDYADDEEVGDNKIYPTRKFEEETDVHKLHEEYDNDTFWDELIDRLRDRDFFGSYGKEKIEKMTQDEYFNNLNKFADKWAEEFEKYDIGRLGIKRNIMNFFKNKNSA